MLKRTVSVIAISFVSLLCLSTQALAQSPVNIGVAAGYPKGSGKFSIVVKDTPNTKLELYVNDKNPTKATVNNKDWATFNSVKLSGTGKLSFTKVVSGKQKPINYTRRYTVTNGKVSFSGYTKTVVASTPSPAKTTTTAKTTTPTPTPTPAPAAPKVLLNLSGNGIENSAPFMVTESQLTVTYSYDCSAEGGNGNFIADLLYGDQSSSNSDDQSIANALSNGATNVTTTIYPADPGNQYHLSVNSECSWTVTVTT